MISIVSPEPPGSAFLKEIGPASTSASDRSSGSFCRPSYSSHSSAQSRQLAIRSPSQRVSWRHPRAIDYRSVQGAVAADGTGNLLSGLAGTVPNTTYSTSIAVTELTGFAARSIGVVIGAIFIVLAFLPKALALVLAVPDPVVAAYATVVAGHAFHGRAKDRRPGRCRPSQELDSGRCLLDRHRFSERGGYFRSISPDPSAACCRTA